MSNPISIPLFIELFSVDRKSFFVMFLNNQLGSGYFIFLGSVWRVWMTQFRWILHEGNFGAKLNCWLYNFFFLSFFLNLRHFRAVAVFLLMSLRVKKTNFVRRKFRKNPSWVAIKTTYLSWTFLKLGTSGYLRHNLFNFLSIINGHEPILSTHK